MGIGDCGFTDNILTESIFYFQLIYKWIFVQLEWVFN